MAEAGSLIIRIIGDTSGLTTGLTAAQGKVVGFAGATDKASGSGKNFGATLGKMAVGATLVGGAVAVASVKLAGDFDASMRKVWSLTNENTSTLEKWKEQIMSLSASGLTQGAEELAEAFYWIKSDMPDATDTQQLETLKIAAMGATGGIAELSDTTSALVQAQNAYKQMDPARYMDVMNMAVQRGSITLQDFVANQGKVVGAAGLAKIPFEEVAAAVSTLTRNAVPADTAFMALNQTIMGFLKPTDEALKTAQQYGIELSLASLQSKGLAGALMEIGTKIPDADLATLFPNVRALKAILPLTGMAMEDFAVDLEYMAEAAGTSENMFNRNVGSMGNQWKIMVNAMKEGAISLGSKILPTVVNAFSAVGRALKGENGAFNTFVKIVKTAAAPVITLTQALAAFWPVLAMGATMFAAFKIGSWVSSLTTSSALIGNIAANLSMFGGVAPIAGLAASLGSIALVAAPAAIATALLVKHVKDVDAAGEAAQKTIRDTDQAMRSLMSSTLPLVNEYRNLKQALVEGKVPADQLEATQKRLTQLQNEIAAKMPYLTSSFDDQGNAILKSDDAVKQYISHLKALDGIKLETSGEMGSYEGTIQDMEHLEKVFTKTKGPLDDLRESLQETTISSWDIDEIIQMLSTDLDAGAKSFQAFMTQEDQAGNIDARQEELWQNSRDSLEEYRLEVEKYGMTSGQVVQKQQELGQALQQLQPQILAQAAELGASGQRLSSDLMIALTSRNQQFQALGQNAVSSYIQGVYSRTGTVTADVSNVANTIAVAVSTGNWGFAWQQAGQIGMNGLLTQIQNDMVTRVLPQINLSSGQIPQEIAWGLRSGVPQIQQATASAMQGYLTTLIQEGGKGAAEAQQIAAQVAAGLASGNYADTGTEAGNRFMAMLAMAAGQTDKLTGPVKKAFEGIKSSAQGGGTSAGTIWTNALTGNLAGSQGKVQAAANKATNIKLPDKRLNIIPQLRPDTLTLKVNTEVNPTFDKPEDAGAYIQRQVQAGANAKASSMILSVMVGGTGGTDPLGVLGSLETSWAQAMRTFGAFKGEMDSKPFRDVEEAIIAITAGNWAALGDWHNLRIAYDNAKASLDKYQAAIKASDDRIAALQHRSQQIQSGLKGWKDANGTVHQSLDVLNRKLQTINETIQKQQERLQTLSQMKLKGEAAADEKSFQLQQQINEAKLAMLKAQDAGNYNEVYRLSILQDELNHQKELVDLQTQVEYDPKKRQIQQALDPLKGQSMTLKQILSQIAKAQSVLKKQQQAQSRVNSEIDKGQSAQQAVNDQVNAEQEAIYNVKKAFQDAQTEVQNYKKSIDEMAQHFITRMNEMKQAAEEAARAGGKAGSGGGGGAPGYASGGLIPRTMEILAHKSEFMVNALGVDTAGIDFLQMLNVGRMPAIGGVAVVGGGSSQTRVTNEYHFHDTVIKTNKAEDFWAQIQTMARDADRRARVGGTVREK